MRFRTWLFALSLAGLQSGLAAQPARSLAVASPTRAEAALLAAEDARFNAELTHDVATLDRMTSADVVYSHVNGVREDKAGVMRTFTHLPFSSITPSNRSARVIGDVGIVRGSVVRQLPDRTLSDGYLAVYEMRDGRWQLLEWVSAAAPPPS
ncbi:nuclear transport factor 2 family protein [Sphingomonas oryzagri]|uniref:Nuclear transport factor 2 family protein n=1 Tax=Sphingomonas oryzagri TaxID=3042314 RepID=A0ABT6N206_9SPHN|nr:nuclear transport factor 2 family protein [Sphingomonas oryzagri]MDH7639323.1 nuclear transport factor 2 family protein [Sphingomonas oryzagri]